MKERACAFLIVMIKTVALMAAEAFAAHVTGMETNAILKQGHAFVTILVRTGYSSFRVLSVIS